MCPLPIAVISLLLMCLLARGRDRPVTHMTSQLANHNHQINSQWSKSCLPLLFSCSRSHFIRIYVTTGSHLRYDPFHIHYKDISNQVNLQVLSCLLSLSILSYLFIHINIRYYLLTLLYIIFYHELLLHLDL